MPLIAGIAAALLVVLAVAAYGYDTSRDDLIAEGVTVAGVKVGGMRADAAATKLRAPARARRSSAPSAWPSPDSASSSPPAGPIWPRTSTEWSTRRSR